MKPVARAGLVALGYVAALAIAWLVVVLYAAATNGSDRQTYQGMFAFGDSLLFLAVFGLAALPVTAVALFFLRRHRGFWVTLSVASLSIGVTSLAAVVIYLGSTAADSGDLLRSWSAFAVLRIFLAPLFAALFLLSALFAPSRLARMSLLAATTIEAASFACVVLTWIQSSHRQ
jgi:hypothetical protein